MLSDILMWKYEINIILVWKNNSSVCFGYKLVRYTLSYYVYSPTSQPPLLNVTIKALKLSYEWKLFIYLSIFDITFYWKNILNVSFAPLYIKKITRWQTVFCTVMKPYQFLENFQIYFAISAFSLTNTHTLKMRSIRNLCIKYSISFFLSNLRIHWISTEKAKQQFYSRSNIYFLA